MNPSISPSPVVALLAESVAKLSLGESSGDYQVFDQSLSKLSSELRLAKPPEAEHLLKPLRALSVLFEQAQCSLPREIDLKSYRHSREAKAGAISNDLSAPQDRADFASRAKRVFEEILSAQRSAGHVYADTSLSKSYCGLLALYVRHGLGEGYDFVPVAQLLQSTLDERLSPEFRAREQAWASHVRAEVTENEDMELLLNDITTNFSAGRPIEAMDEAAVYMARVQRAVESFDGALVTTGARLAPFEAYKYAFLFGLISETKFTTITACLDDKSPQIRQFDPEIFKKGAILAARTQVEHRCIDSLTPDNERVGTMHDESGLSPHCYFGRQSLHPVENGFVDLTDDYWNIAAPMLTARVFHRNICEQYKNRLPHNGHEIASSSYLAGIKYIRDFGANVSEHGGMVVQ